jgi:RimJ/RimL family protein N-acetyltransferase
MQALSPSPANPLDSAWHVDASLAAQAFPLIRAVIDGQQPGTIWRGGDAKHPCAVVLTRFGFMQWLGHCDDTDFNQRFATQLAQATPQLPGYLLWYAPPAHWQDWLAGQAGVRERERVRWTFQALPSHDDTDGSLPAGFASGPLTAELARRAEPLGMNLGSRFWPSLDDLLLKGVGVCITTPDDDVAACAYSACVSDGVAEADIAVAPSLRTQGLGLAAGRAFVQACLDRAIKPTWDCFTHNEPSMRLAALLGFAPSRRYAMASFNVPLRAPGADSRPIP